MFHSFLSNDIKQYSTSTATHRKHITELLKKRQHFFMILVQCGIIKMVVTINKYAPRQYI